MRDILFLTHRIPYPPDKGDKIRAWNILQHLASRHRVHLGTFIDEPEDVRGLERLEKVCASVFWRPLSPRLARLRSLRCLLSGAPLTQGYFGDARFRAETDRVVARYKPSLFYIFSSAMAPYVTDQRGARVIIDMVDVDSEKWRQYAETSHGLARLIYAREGRALLALERQAAADADSVVFVSRAEAALFARLAPELSSRIHYVNNGVDSEHFGPSAKFPNPLGDRPAIVFTGMMNYRPNVEAMSWFVEQVMPRLRAHPKAPCLWIVGSNPCRAVLALAGPDVRVTGRVPDVRPYLRYAAAVVAPLQIARGIQNKVLEAMAMGAAVVVTPQAHEGLDRCSAEELLTAATGAEFADAVVRILDGAAGPIGARARARVVRDYRWRASLTTLDQLVDAEPSGSAPPGGMSAVGPLQVSA